MAIDVMLIIRGPCAKTSGLASASQVEAYRIVVPEMVPVDQADATHSDLSGVVVAACKGADKVGAVGTCWVVGIGIDRKVVVGHNVAVDHMVAVAP